MVDKFSVEKNNQKIGKNPRWCLTVTELLHVIGLNENSDKWTPMETFDFSCIKTMVIIIDCESSKFFVQFSKFLCQRLRAKKNFEIHFMPHI